MYGNLKRWQTLTWLLDAAISEDVDALGKDFRWWWWWLLKLKSDELRKRKDVFKEGGLFVADEVELVL